MAAERGTAGTASTGFAASAGAASTGRRDGRRFSARELGELLVDGVAVVDRRRARGARGVLRRLLDLLRAREHVAAVSHGDPDQHVGQNAPSKARGRRGPLGLPRLGSGLRRLGRCRRSCLAFGGAGAASASAISDGQRHGPFRPPLRSVRGELSYVSPFAVRRELEFPSALHALVF